MTCCAVDPRRAPSTAARLLALLLLPLAAAGCASTDTPAGSAPLAAVQPERLINLSLSPALSQWLVGPVAVLATVDEEREFLALRDDAAAEAFIEEFWASRNPYPLRPDNALRTEFERRAAVADRLYSEGGRTGLHTARGTIYVLYGNPTRTDFEIASNPRDPAITVWFYEGEQEPGLDGERPGPIYRFIKRDDLTTFYTPLVGIERARPVRPEDL